MTRAITLLSLITLSLATHGCAQTTGPDAVDVQQAAQTLRADEVHPSTEAGAGRAGSNVDLPRFPSISPDGSSVVFSWRGDLWRVPSTGGQAHRLTSHPGDDLRSAWSRDGSRIAFTSDRTGFENIHLMRADGSDIRPVTDTDCSCRLSGFGQDDAGREVVTFAAHLEGDTLAYLRPYMIPTGGGDMVRVHDAFGSFPVMSPDHTRVAFTRGNARWSRRHYRGPASRDVWVYNTVDDSFVRLTTWEGNDSQPRWAGNDTLLFLSDRELNCVNLYRMDAGQGDRKAQRLTGFADNDVKSFDVSADGSTAVLMVWDTLYTLALNEKEAQPAPLMIYAGEDSGDPYELKAIDREVSEAALSPDGKVMAFVAYGEVYVRHLDEKSPARRITRSHAREKHIAWSPNGLKLYFVSDRSGTDSIYEAAVALTRTEVKEDFDAALNPPEEKEPKEEAPAEASDDSDSNHTAPGSNNEPDATDAESIPKSDTEPEPVEEEDAEPDKKKDEEDKEKDLPKELRSKRWHDAIAFTITPVMEVDYNDRLPSPSPDGKHLAFRRGNGNLMILQLDDGVVREFTTGWDPDLHWRWSPDSRYIAYAQSNLNFNTDIWIAPVDGSQPPVNVTRHPDNDVSPRWSADGKILSFLSERVNEEFDLWMVYLDENLETFTPKELEQYYKDAAEAAKKRKPLEVKKPEEDKEAKEADKPGESEPDQSTDKSGKAKDDAPSTEEKADEKKEEPQELDLENAYLRLRRVTTLSGSEDGNALTPGGDRYIFNATIGERGLFSVKWDGTDRKRLTDSADVQHVSLTGDKVIFLTKGRAGTVGPGGGKVEYVDIADKIRIDLEQQSSQKFREAARLVGENFYQSNMKGLDWPALTEKYHTLAKRAHTANEFNHVANRFLGELNASHLGVFASDPDSPNAQAQGRLGTVHHRVDDGYEITRVIPESPAAKGKMALEVGDVITAIELEPFGPTDTVETRLRGRTDRETLLTIRRTLSDGQTKELSVLVTPISFSREARLKYRAWRQENARLAEEWSDGRIGYIHIRSMGQSALDVFERDLYAAAGDKEGLIIDVRSNGGGWTTDRLLASIMAPYHAYTVPRGGDPGHTNAYPQDRLFIQRYTLPINMLCNEESFSNAEIIAHAFKTLKRGTLVGQQTYGAVISTGGARLIDGTWVRLPFRGWFLPDGTDMENHGAMPDIVVPQTPEAESRNDDEQLRAAVEDLLKRLD